MFNNSFRWTYMVLINNIKQHNTKSSEEWSLQLWMQFMQLRKKPEKKMKDFNGIWTLDQLSSSVAS